MASSLLGGSQAQVLIRSLCAPRDHVQVRKCFLETQVFEVKLQQLEQDVIPPLPLHSPRQLLKDLPHCWVHSLQVHRLHKIQWLELCFYPHRMRTCKGLHTRHLDLLKVVIDGRNWTKDPVIQSVVWRKGLGKGLQVNRRTSPCWSEVKRRSGNLLAAVTAKR